MPSLVRVVLVCQSGGDDGSNELGFAANDELDVHSIINDLDDNHRGFHSVVADATNVTVTIHATTLLYVMGKNVNNLGYLTRDKWKIKVYATP